MPKSLSGKVIVIYSVLILFIVAVGIVATLSLLQLRAMVDNFIENNYKSIQATDEMLEIVDRQDSAALSYLALDQAFGEEVFSRSAVSFSEWLNVIQARVADQAVRERIDSIEHKSQEYFDEFTRMTMAFDNGLNDLAHNIYQDDMVETFLTLKNDLRFVRDWNIGKMYSKRDEVNRADGYFIAALLTLTVVFTAGGLILALGSVRNFLNPLRQLTDSIQQVNEGSFNRPLRTGSTGEIAILEDNFNRMLERLRAYEESNIGLLLAEKQKLTLVLDNMEDLLFILDDRSLVETINPAACAYFHLDRETAEGQPFETIVSQQAIVDLVATFSGERQTKLLELGTGQMFYIILTRVQRTAATGEKLELLIQDVTELKRTEQIRTDFIASISHELKTPLTGIVMGISMLQEPTCDSTELLEVIGEDAERLQELIDQLVSMCKLQNDNASYRMQAQAPWSLAEKAVCQYADLARMRGAEIENAVKHGLPPVEADAEKIGWVLSNLLNNAIKYIEIDGHVSIGAEVGAEFVTFYVQDTGAGIPDEYIDKLFYMVFRPKEENVVEYRGSGIGLYLSQRIITAHDGKIWAENRAEGGSRFLFTLPRRDRRNSK